MNEEMMFVTPEELLAALRAPEESINVPNTGDVIPVSEMEACISENGQMPPLPPLPNEEMLLDMSDQALAFLARIVQVASVAFAHLRQKHDFDAAVLQMVVLERHMLQRQETVGELH
jgi:hypothetical protein